MKLLPQFVLRTTAAVLLASAAASTAAGQQPKPPPPPSDREATRGEMIERSRALETLEKTVHAPPERTGPRLDLARIEEDHLRLQQVANGLHQAAAQGGALDLKAVVKSATEIRERAVRLGAALALPKSEEKEDKRAQPAAIADDEGLRGAVAALHELIYRFARSPVFTDINLVDAEQSAKARRDLDEIIALSERVKEGSEWLRKAARRPR